MRLSEWLTAERDDRVSGGLYHTTQLEFAYNSNHMEGSTLTPEQTAQLWDNGTLLPEGAGDVIRADDVIETVNHFRAFDWMLDHVDDPVDRTLVCTLHAILKRGTRQETDPDRNTGGWKVLPNVIGGIETVHTVLPADVPAAMEAVFRECAALEDEPYAVAHMHWMFETTHPFSDGNGRVGRLVLFKELMRLDAVPPVILDADRAFYIRGLARFGSEPGWLVDTLLAERDRYRLLIDTLAPGRIDATYADRWEDRAAAEARCAAEPETNPYVRGEWTGEDIRGRVASERSVPGVGFVGTQADKEEKA